MVDFQLPLPGLARNPEYLTSTEREFLSYFSAIDPKCLSPVANLYRGVGPKGYGESFRIASQLKALRKNDLYRFVTQDIQPSHNTFNTLRRRLGVDGYIEIHRMMVAKAHSLGLLTPDIRELPKGIILIADSTFLITSGSTKGNKDENGSSSLL